MKISFKIIILLIFIWLFNLQKLQAQEEIKIGLLVPLSGKQSDIGKSIMQSIRLAINKIDNPNIKILPKDTRNDPVKTLAAAKELELEGVKIVIGPIFHESLERLDEISNVTFISLTNKTENIPKNTIAFGINIESQMSALKKYFDEIEVSKTLLLYPFSEFSFESETVEKNDVLKFYRTYPYDINPKKKINIVSNAKPIRPALTWSGFKDSPLKPCPRVLASMAVIPIKQLAAVIINAARNEF